MIPGPNCIFSEKHRSKAVSGLGLRIVVIERGVGFLTYPGLSFPDDLSVSFNAWYNIVVPFDKTLSSFQRIMRRMSCETSMPVQSKPVTAVERNWSLLLAMLVMVKDTTGNL